MKINSERLAKLFVTMCEIDSPSGHEATMSNFLQALFRQEFSEAELVEDHSAEITGCDCGNLIARFPGTQHAASPIFFNCHMDTVTPGLGVKVRRDGNRFFSNGDTVLGGDDKAGIAILIEALRTVKEANAAYPPIELLFTTAEEIGLRGAKALDIGLLRARQGYALDSTGVDLVITGAPAANRFSITVTGLASHAGLHPEGGINAIQVAARCLADLPMGRLDEESTANIGVIQGGTATNIVAESVRIDGEVRSHSPHKLAAYTNEIETRIRTAIDHWQPAVNADLPDGTAPRLDFQVSHDYPAMHLDLHEEVVQRVVHAGARLGRSIRCIRAGGGSDANIFNGKGLHTAIIGIGMDKVHTTEETILLDDMTCTAELIVSMITS